MYLSTMRVSASGAAAEQASGSNRCTTKKCCQLQRELGASYRPLIKLPKDQSLAKGLQVMCQASTGHAILLRLLTRRERLPAAVSSC
jgi:hypothetical protein